MHRNNCICEYCCSVRDEEDDREMEQEYKLYVSLGQPIFDSLNVGDQVEYYAVPSKHRHTVFGEHGLMPIEDPTNAWELSSWQIFKKYATSVFKGTIVSKGKVLLPYGERIEIERNGHTQNIGPAECFSWGIHKI